MIILLFKRKNLQNRVIQNLRQKNPSLKALNSTHGMMFSVVEWQRCRSSRVVEYHIIFFSIKKNVWVNPPKLCVESQSLFNLFNLSRSHLRLSYRCIQYTYTTQLTDKIFEGTQPLQ